LTPVERSAAIVLINVKALTSENLILRSFIKSAPADLMKRLEG
jgi:hypothetical protein